MRGHVDTPALAPAIGAEPLSGGGIGIHGHDDSAGEFRKHFNGDAGGARGIDRRSRSRTVQNRENRMLEPAQDIEQSLLYRGQLYVPRGYGHWRRRLVSQHG